MAGFDLVRSDLPLLVAEFRRAGVAFTVCESHYLRWMLGRDFLDDALTAVARVLERTGSGS